MARASIASVIELPAERAAAFIHARRSIFEILRPFSDMEREQILRLSLLSVPNETDRETMAAIRGQARFGAEWLADKLGIEHTAANNRLKRLSEIGSIQRAGKEGRRIIFQHAPVDAKRRSR